LGDIVTSGVCALLPFSDCRVKERFNKCHDFSVSAFNLSPSCAGTFKFDAIKETDELHRQLSVGTCHLESYLSSLGICYGEKCLKQVKIAYFDEQLTSLERL
jgi:hypothetical protein